MRVSPPIRMGLRYVKGLSEKTWERIEAERSEKPFASVEDLVDRTELNEGSLMRLAEAGALSPLDDGRRSAMWRVRGRARGARPSLPVSIREKSPAFSLLDDFVDGNDMRVVDSGQSSGFRQETLA